MGRPSDHTEALCQRIERFDHTFGRDAAVDDYEPERPRKPQGGGGSEGKR